MVNLPSFLKEKDVNIGLCSLREVLFFLAENEEPIGARYDDLKQGHYPQKDKPPKRSQFTQGWHDELHFYEEDYGKAFERYKAFRLWEEWLFQKIQNGSVKIYKWNYAELDEGYGWRNCEEIAPAEITTTYNGFDCDKSTVVLREERVVRREGDTLYPPQQVSVAINLDDVKRALLLEQDEYQLNKTNNLIALEKAVKIVALHLSVPFVYGTLEATENAKDSLFNALHTGEIKAFGCFGGTKRDDYKNQTWEFQLWDGYALERQPIPPAFWIKEGVNWQASSVKRFWDGEYISVVLDETELEKMRIESVGSMPDANTIAAQAIKNAYGHNKNLTQSTDLETLTICSQAISSAFGHNENEAQTPANTNHSDAQGYTTPYIQLMLRAIKENNITEDNQSRVYLLHEWFREQRIDGGSLSKSDVEKLTSFIRFPRSRGGSRENGSKKPKRLGSTQKTKR